MHPSPTKFAFSAAALTLFLAPAVASASSAAPSPQSRQSPSHRAHVARVARVAHVTKATPCAKPAVEVVAGAESATFSLSKCDGTATLAGIDQLSLLARPGSAPKPTESIATLAKVHGPELAPGIRRVDPRLVEHLELAVEHFHKEGQPARVVLVSGYRPKNSGSYHAAGRALDFRIEGVTNEALVAFCKTMPDTGCGYYPNSVFVHMDVRDHGAGHIAWVDTSHPGEAPRYVSAPPAEAAAQAPAQAVQAPADKLPALPSSERRARASASLAPGST